MGAGGTERHSLNQAPYSKLPAFLGEMHHSCIRLYLSGLYMRQSHAQGTYLCLLMQPWQWALLATEVLKSDANG